MGRPSCANQELGPEKEGLGPGGQKLGCMAGINIFQLPCFDCASDNHAHRIVAHFHAGKHTPGQFNMVISRRYRSPRHPRGDHRGCRYRGCLLQETPRRNRASGSIC